MACSQQDTLSLQPAALPGLSRTCWFHLDYLYLEPADFKGGVDQRERRMDVGNSGLQALHLPQALPIAGMPVELLRSPPLHVFTATLWKEHWLCLIGLCQLCHSSCTSRLLEIVHLKGHITCKKGQHFASSFQSSRHPDWTEMRHDMCILLLALLRTSDFLQLTLMLT